MNKKHNDNSKEPEEVSQNISLDTEKEKAESIPKRILSFFVRHRILTSILFTIVTLFIALSPFVAINFPNNRDAHSIGSIALDRWDMNRVNRIEASTPAGVTVIENRQLIRDIVRATMAARTTGFMEIWDGVYFRLYRGDRLVREMEFGGKHNHVIVFRPSKRHWFFFAGSSVHAERGGGGWVQLSDGLVDRIERYLMTYGNSLWPRPNVLPPFER